jgi:hypothetical protein
VQPLQTDVVADRVFRQADFVGVLPNQNGNPGATTLFDPTDVFIDAANAVWITDTPNCRVLEYDEPGTAPINFALPAVAGPAYVQAINPPYVPFSSSGNAQGGSLRLL